MTVQLIGVGSQSRLRQVLQTNMDILKEDLGLLGIHTPSMPAVADTQQRLQQQIAEALNAGQSVIIVGGIGGGSDLTVSTVCKGLGVQPVADQLSYSQMSQRCKAAGEPLPQGARSGVKVPEGATVFRSHTGGYPGSAVASGGQCIIMLPDDPAELRAMLDTTVFSYLSEFSGQPAVRRRIGAAGLSASQAAAMLEDMSGRRNPCVSVTAGAGEVLVRVTAVGQSLSEAAALAQKAVDTVNARLGSCVYGVDADGLAPALAAMLRQSSAQVAVAEAGTGGALAAALAAQHGQILAGAFDTAGAEGKAGLGITARQLKEWGPCSQETAAAMADAARRQTGAALGMAIVAEGQENGHHTVCLALTDRRHVWTRRLSVNSSSGAFVRTVAANQMMNMARLYAGHYSEILPGAKELAQVLPAASHRGPSSRSAQNKRGHSAAQEESGMKKARSDKAPFWTRFIPVKGDSKREIIRKAIFWLAVVVFISSVAYIISVQMESVNNEKLTTELSGMLVDDDYEVEGDYPENYLHKFAALWERNPDIAGWIEIPGTQVNYAVVQTVNNSYYERRDFDKKDNNHGVPFVDYRVDQEAPSTNTVIYAHNMNDGQMFGELMNYKTLAYYKEHPVIRYDSVYRENQYKIIGVFLVTANDPDFLYHSMINMDEAEMVEFVNQVRSRSLINTKVDVMTTDHLITLSTCDYSFKDANGNRVARFVVVGRAVRDGEDPTVDTSVVTLNANPVMPTEWYEQIARNQAAADLAAAEAAASQSAAEAANAEKLTAWLTQAEIDELTSLGYSESDMWYVADERRIELSQWLSEDELTSMTVAEKLSTMKTRRERKWLSGSDIGDLTDEEKEAKIEANMLEASRWLTQAEIDDARSWKNIQQLIETKKAAAESSAAEESSRLEAENAAKRAAAEQLMYDNGLDGLNPSDYQNCLNELLNASGSSRDNIIQHYRNVLAGYSSSSSSSESSSSSSESSSNSSENSTESSNENTGTESSETPPSSDPGSTTGEGQATAPANVTPGAME